MGKCTDKEVRTALRGFLKKAKKKFKIEKTLLFGSRARDDWLVTSDVDILLVSDDFENMPMRERMATALELWEGDVDLEPLCYTSKEFERMKKRVGIVSQAVKEGVNI